MRYPFFFAFFCLLSAPQFLSAKTSSTSQRIPLDGIQEVRFSGWHVNLKLVANDEIRFARIRATGPFDPQIRTENGRLSVAMIPPEFAEENLDADTVPVEVIVEMPSRPVIATFRTGKIQSSNWSQNARYALVGGKINAVAHKGSLRVNLRKGEFLIRQHAGDIDVSVYDGAGRLQEVSGPISLFQFSGTTHIQQSQGPIDIKGHNSKVRVEESEGRLTFSLTGGQLRTVRHKGPVEGDGQEARLFIGLQKDPFARIKSKTGKVVVSLPENTGTYLNFGSVSGDIVVPPHLTVDRFPNIRVARGRLKGTDGRGRVRVRTESAISIFRVDR